MGTGFSIIGIPSRGGTSSTGRRRTREGISRSSSPSSLSLRRLRLVLTCLLGLVIGRAWGSSSSASSASFPCNVTLYEEWYNIAYEGALTTDTDMSDFWIFSSAELTNGQAMEKIHQECHIQMQSMFTDRAGRHGPVEEWYIYDIMCGDECIINDMLRQEAMAYCGCTCTELSTQPNSPLYHLEADWCRTSSGRILCSVFEMCDEWQCSYDDYMCPRYEYNKGRVPYRGLGDCGGATGKLQALSFGSMVGVWLVAVLGAVGALLVPW